MLRQVRARSAPAARRPSCCGPRRPTSRPHRAPPAARNPGWRAGGWCATVVSKDLGRTAPGCVCGAEERSRPRVADRRKASRRANRVRGPVPGWAAQQHAQERPSYSRARGWRAPQGTPRSGAPQSQPGTGRPRSSRRCQHACSKEGPQRAEMLRTSATGSHTPCAREDRHNGRRSRTSAPCSTRLRPATAAAPCPAGSAHPAWPRSAC
jgi:hypothetical protein